MAVVHRSSLTLVEDWLIRNQQRCERRRMTGLLVSKKKMYLNAPKLCSITTFTGAVSQKRGNDGKTKPSIVVGFVEIELDWSFMVPQSTGHLFHFSCGGYTPVLVARARRIPRIHPQTAMMAEWIIQKYAQLNFSLSIKIVEWIFRLDRKEAERKIYVHSRALPWRISSSDLP